MFENNLQDLGWKIPLLISLMKESNDLYFSSIDQVQIPCWSKERVALIGDAAHSVQSMGTSLAMVGAYVLAREIDESDGDYKLAFNRYEKVMRKPAEEAQKLARSNQQAFTQSSLRMKIQLCLMKILPKKFLQFMTDRGRKEMRKVSHICFLEA